ncbi:hypothetical protein GAYE_SCF08G3119 [Galdieria yellowstonensis]|uniref:Agmatine deiminase n=1 Tax=Galdieria yellowstonensis TaxID=3028027 RepID=A0AAV9ICW5_9RHOD|nr:hypothetical protein GAYE_SCF08G3119 [Galdieria yellowstonensis]
MQHGVQQNCFRNQPPRHKFVVTRKEDSNTSWNRNTNHFEPFNVSAKQFRSQALDPEILKDGYIFPAKWCSYKHRFISAQRAIADTAKSEFESVTVVASNLCGRKPARMRLQPPIRVIQIVRGAVFNFTAWGGPAEPACADYPLDTQFAENLLQVENVSQYHAGMVLEGGESLLKPNRKPSMSKEDIENRLKELLGIKKAVWFPNGVYGDDDTSGHVGNMFQFTQPGTVVLHYL